MRSMCLGSLNKVNDIRWNSRFYCCCLHIRFFHSLLPPDLCLAFACALHFSSNTSKLLVSHCHPKTTNIWGWNRETAKGNTYCWFWCFSTKLQIYKYHRLCKCRWRVAQKYQHSLLTKHLLKLSANKLVIYRNLLKLLILYKLDFM